MYVNGELWFMIKGVSKIKVFLEGIDFDEVKFIFKLWCYCKIKDL